MKTKESLSSQLDVMAYNMVIDGTASSLSEAYSIIGNVVAENKQKIEKEPIPGQIIFL